MTMKFKLFRQYPSKYIIFSTMIRHISIFPKLLIFLVNNYIGHLLETSWGCFGPNKFRKVINNIHIHF